MRPSSDLLRTTVLAAVIVIANAAAEDRSGAASAPAPAALERHATGLGGGSCPADLTGNGKVDAADLAILLGAWGPCELACLDPDENPVDLNCFGSVECSDEKGNIFVVDLFECFCLDGASQIECCQEITTDLASQCDFPGGSVVPGSLFCGCQ